jgi:hypothetical protein
MILLLAKEKIELDNEDIPVICSTLKAALHYVVLGVPFIRRAHLASGIYDRTVMPWEPAIGKPCIIKFK